MTCEPLWAKSWPASSAQLVPASARWLQHLRDVHAAAMEILDACGRQQLEILGLAPRLFEERFRRIVRLAGATHDLGKANSHFQGMIQGKRDLQKNPQGLRHEWISVLLLEDLRGQISPLFGEFPQDFDLVQWAIAGHHPARTHASHPQVPSGAGIDIDVYTDHPDYHSALSWLSETFRVSLSVTPTRHTLSLVGANSIVHRITRWHQTQSRLWHSLRLTPERKLVAAVKACLIAADVAGSALPRLELPIEGELGWVRQALAVAPSRDDLERIVDVRLSRSRGSTVDSLDDQARNTFQSNVAQSTQRVTLVKAGCGTGKTLAAYQWAARNHPGKRLFFCYPTTGTATEGFGDYLYEPDGELGDLGARLFHSRRDVDLELLAGSRGFEAERDALARQTALDTWRTPVAACTVDTVLGLLHNHPRALFSWPALVQSVFVFDEIHSYDETLFGTLLRFLDTFVEVPVLLMTASLPAGREKALQELLARQGAEWNPISGPLRLETRPRYQWSGELERDPWLTVCECLNRKENILWVCNQVQRCMDVATEGLQRGLTPIVYHSRFRYIDRIQRHREVIYAFGAPRGSLAICTQVAEMSLDLSADLLVTDLAPIPALIQRLGRLNRRASENGPTQPFLVVEPGSHLPYRPEELTAAEDWLNRLPQRGICQADLVAAWQTDASMSPTKSECAWLDGGPTTKVGDLREGSPTIPILLPDDLHRVQAVPRDLPRYVVPMSFPKQKDEVSSWQRFRMVRVAPPGAIDYDSRWGARWSS